MSRLPRRVGRALVECVRSAGSPAGAPALLRLAGASGGLGPLVDAAAAHGVSGFVWRAVRAAGLGDRPDVSLLRGAVAVAAGRHLRSLAEVERVDAALRDMPWLLFKGPVLAEVVYGSPILRSPVDLDVLVPRASFEPAVRSLERAGCVVYERNWTLVRSAELGSLRLHTPTGALIDLHWDLLNDAAARAALTVSSADALARAREVSLGHVGRVRTLDPVDTVVHLALHAALAGAHRLVWLADVAAAYRHLTPTDRATVRIRAAAWSVEPALALVLRRCGAVLGHAALTPAAEDPGDSGGPGGPARRGGVAGRGDRDGRHGSNGPTPKSVDSQRVGSGMAVGMGWRAVCAVADTLAPVSRWSEGPTLAAAVARSARADSRTSLRELRHHALTAIRSGRARHDPQALFDPTDPTSVAYPSGGPTERGAYLTDVSGTPS